MLLPFLLLFAAFISFFVFWLWGKTIVYPKGKKFEHTTTDEYYRAIVIAEPEIAPGYRGGFIFAGDKINGKELAEACTLAMRAVDTTIIRRGPEVLGRALEKRKSQKSLSAAVFNFVSNKTFARLATEAGFENPQQFIAFSTMLKNKAGKPDHDFPVITIRCENIKAVLEKGSLAIHELVHVASFLSLGDWDYKEHKLWHNLDYLCDDGRNIDWLAKEYWRARRY